MNISRYSNMSDYDNECNNNIIVNIQSSNDDDVVDKTNEDTSLIVNWWGHGIDEDINIDEDMDFVDR